MRQRDKDMKKQKYYSSKEFEEKYTYKNNDLGAVWTPEQTTFRLWAPEADNVWVNIFCSGEKNASFKSIPMEESKQGTWQVSVQGNLNKFYYTYLVERMGKRVEVPDPYAVASGANGKRSMVLDLKSTDPQGWENDHNPNAQLKLGEIIICEAHVRDISVDESSGICQKGKFLGIVETGTRTAQGDKTGLDYLKDLGITHLHLLPVFDFASVDEETEEEDKKYNWGYDPLHYNIPEGSYATDAKLGEVRIKEFKHMVKILHENGISLILDVVYNHVHNAETFCINQIVPGYFSRIDENGNYSNGSRCGNDTATERSMVKKYIVDSILYWLKEYHIDGFRFDLAGLIDTEVINEIVKQARAIRPDVVLYGEGWHIPTYVTKSGYKMATQNHAIDTPGFAYFNDSIRDTLKGRIAFDKEKGYINGARHQVDAVKNNMSGVPFWSPSPENVVQYLSCHDDLTLYDKICLSSQADDQELLLKYNLLGAAVLFASAGIVFFPLGEEMLRSKKMKDGTFCSDSYNAGDAVNVISWGRQKEEKIRIAREYYKGLIKLRKIHPALCQTHKDSIYRSREFIDVFGHDVIYLVIDGTKISGEKAEKIVVIINPESKPVEIELPDFGWNIYAEGREVGIDAIRTLPGNHVCVEAISAMYLMKEA